MVAWPNASSNLFKTSSFFLLMFPILESVLEFCFLRLHIICYKLTWIDPLDQRFLALSPGNFTRKLGALQGPKIHNFV